MIMIIPAAFEFECPVKTHYGERALEHLPFELHAMDATKPLVLGDGPAGNEKRLTPVLNAFRDTQMTLGVVEDLPLVDMDAAVHQLAAIYRDKDCDAIIAVGQGPCVDAAKWLNLVVSTGQETLAPFIEGQTVPRTLKPLAIIPSATADGFEMSGYLRTEEVTLRSVNLMPQLAFIDSRMSGQPDEGALTETALVALTQGVEAFFRMEANPLTAIYARTAARLAATALHQLAGRGKDHDHLALTVSHAAALAGCALGCQCLAYSHRLAAAVAETGRVSRAQAMGILLSYVMEHRAVNGTLDADALLGLLGGIDRYTRTPGNQRGAAALYLLRNLLNQLFEKTDGRICRTLQDTGLTLAEVKHAAGQAAASAAGNDPAVYETILTHAWEGRPFR